MFFYYIVLLLFCFVRLSEVEAPLRVTQNIYCNVTDKVISVFNSFEIGQISFAFCAAF